MLAAMQIEILNVGLGLIFFGMLALGILSLYGIVLIKCREKWNEDTTIAFMVIGGIIFLVSMIPLACNTPGCYDAGSSKNKSLPETGIIFRTGIEPNSPLRELSLRAEPIEIPVRLKFDGGSLSFQPTENE